MSDRATMARPGRSRESGLMGWDDSCERCFSALRECEVCKGEGSVQFMFGDCTECDGTGKVCPTDGKFWKK
jgi:RecJ-like exonuclease